MSSDAAELATVYTVFADLAEAERVSRTVVEERLAACANILGPCTSIYRWNGSVHDARESAVLFKTTVEAAQRLCHRIAELHSYDLPAVESWPTQAGNAAVRDWVRSSVS